MSTAVLKLSSPPTRQFWEIPILHEDEHLLALDKPAGLPISPDRNEPGKPVLLRLLHAAVAAGKPWASERKLTYLMNTYRLETDASGVLLFARNKAAFLAAANQLNSGRPGLKFVALAQGVPVEDRFEVEAKLAPDPVRPGLLKVDARRGKQSRTIFEVVERFRDFTLLRCEPWPIRPHQIRVHLRVAKLALAGDEFFGGRPLLLSRLKPTYHLKAGETERPLLARPAVHAEELALTHPVTGQPLAITAPWPRELSVGIKYLRRYGAM